ncbi:MAG TPA: Ig domain-containing protein, partial [Dehalococcoidia bacterium]|nr:Ig domain-containing protein [Dehalococcoidia bacterium]
MLSASYLNRVPRKTLAQASRYLLIFVLASALFLGSAGKVLAAQPVVTPESLSSWQVNVAYSHAFSSSPIGGTATWAMNGIVPGLSLNPSTGVLSGTPTTIGTYQFYIQVTDSADPT